MENFFQRKSIDGTYTTVPIDQPFMSKLIIYVEEPTVSSNSFNWYAVAMYGMTSRNLFHFKQKKNCEPIDGFGKRYAIVELRRIIRHCFLKKLNWIVLRQQLLIFCMIRMDKTISTINTINRKKWLILFWVRLHMSIKTSAIYFWIVLPVIRSRCYSMTKENIFICWNAFGH